MKKSLLIFTALAFTICTIKLNAQILNQAATWPNTNWTISGTYNAVGFTFNPTASSNFLYDDDLSGNASLSDDINAESPIINLTSAFNGGEIWAQVSCDYVYRANSSDLKLEYWDADASNWINWEVLNTNSTNTSYKSCSNSIAFTSIAFDFSGFSTTQLTGFKYRIRYDDLGSFDWGFCMESPTIFSSGPPSCIDPSNLSTSGVLDTSVTMNWMENGTAILWDIQYDTTGFALGTGNTITAVNTNPYILSGLSGNTSYDVYVRSNCGPGDSSNWVGPVTFTTFCQPVVAPWVEDFENNGNIPNCWIQGLNNNEDWLFDTTGGHVGNAGNIGGITSSGGNFAYVDDSQPHSANTMLVSPRIDISAIVNPELTFYLISNNEGNSNVDFSMDVFDGTIWNTNFYTNNSNTVNGEWELITLDLTSLTFSGNIQFRFFVNENNGGDFYDDIAIDDIDVHSGPTCFDPFNLTATNINATSADLGWTVQDSASNWYIEYGPSGFTPGNGTFVLATSNPFNLTGISASTTYDYYVQSICAVGDSSNWAGPFNFSTPCLSVAAPWSEDFDNGGQIPLCWAQDSLNNEFWLFDTTANSVGAGGVINSNTTSGTYFAYVDDSGPNSNNTGLLSPTIDLSALSVPELTFYLISNSQGAANVDFSLDVWDGANWNNDFFTSNSNTLNGEWELITIYFASVTISGDIQLRFRVSEQGGFFNNLDDIAIDDVDIHEAPPCPNPSDLFVDSIGSTNAQLNWLENGSATMWDIQIDTTGFILTGSTTTASTNPYTITGLVPQTTYDFYVRSNCGTDTSAWIGPFTFTTSCLSVTAPWTEDFDALINTIPECWRQGTNNNENWLFDSNGGHVGNAGVWTGSSHSGGQFAYVDDSGPHSTGTMLISPMIDVSSLTMPEFSFYVISNNEGSSNVDFSVDIWDGSNWNIGYYTRNSNTLNGDWELVIVSINSLTITGDMQFRFIVDENNGNGFSDDIAIDDIDIREGPPCPQPSNLTGSNASANSIDLTWTENGSATMWNVIWGPPGFSISGTGTSVSVTNYSITGLTNLTSYDVYVRADCGTDTSAWVGPFTVTTLADYCAGDLFYDSGGPNGNYSNGEITITTICPTTTGEAVTVFFNQFQTQNNADPLYIFNGPDTSSMLFDSGNPPTFGGFPAGGYYGNNLPGAFVSSDPTGCLTFMFMSNGFNNQDGWEAGIACGPPPCPGGIVSLLGDTSICTSESLLLDAGGAGAYTYLWSTGETTQTISVDSSSLGGIGTYSINVYVIDNNQNCSDRDTVEINIESCVGIKDVSENVEFNIYPNPNTGLFVIDLTDAIKTSISITVTDITGKKILQSEIFRNNSTIKNEIDLRDHAKGIYFITIKSKTGIITKKLVIQ